MNSKRIISLLLLTVYIVAASANSLGILRCDCAAHHSHDLCCGHDRHDDGHSHDHSLCAAFCQTEQCLQMLTRHCSCTHRHSEDSVYTVSCDTGELLKYIKLSVDSAVCAVDIQCSSLAAAATCIVRCRDDIPIAAPPAISAGAPRAPSFLA